MSHQRIMLHKMRKARRQLSGSSTTVWWTPQPGDAAYSSPVSTPVIDNNVASTAPAQTLILSTPTAPLVRVVSTTKAQRRPKQTTVLVEPSSIGDPASSASSILPVASTSAVTLESLSALESGALSGLPLVKVASNSIEFSSPASSSRSSSASTPSASASSPTDLIDIIKSSPAYIALASLIGIVVVVLLCGSVAFLVRRGCRRRKARVAGDPFDDNASRWVTDNDAASIPSARPKSSRAISFISHQGSDVAQSVEEGLIIPSPAYLGSKGSHSNSNHSWSEKSDTNYTALPPRSVRSHRSQPSDPLSHIGHSPDLRTASGQAPPLVPMPESPRRTPLVQDPGLLPWITVMGSALDSTSSAEPSPEVTKSRFSSFSTTNELLSKRASADSQILPPKDRSKRISGLRNQLARTHSNASSASIWSSSTGLTENTFEPRSETTRMHRRSSLSSNDSIQTRVSVFREQLSNGTGPRSLPVWKALAAQDGHQTAHTSRLLKQRLSH